MRIGDPQGISHNESKLCAESRLAAAGTSCDPTRLMRSDIVHTHMTETNDNSGLTRCSSVRAATRADLLGAANYVSASAPALARPCCSPVPHNADASAEDRPYYLALQVSGLPAWTRPGCPDMAAPKRKSEPVAAAAKPGQVPTTTTTATATAAATIAAAPFQSTAWVHALCHLIACLNAKHHRRHDSDYPRKNDHPTTCALIPSRVAAAGAFPRSDAPHPQRHRPRAHDQ